jgi:hypothetical protein
MIVITTEVLQNENAKYFLRPGIIADFLDEERGGSSVLG